MKWTILIEVLYGAGFITMLGAVICWGTSMSVVNDDSFTAKWLRKTAIWTAIAIVLTIAGIILDKCILQTNLLR